MKNNYIKKRINAFSFAFQGIKTFYCDAPHATIHTIFALLAILLGIVFNISRNEWLTICVVIGFVFALEMVNTALEKLADYACGNEMHPRIKAVKDIAAGAVLVAAITSVVVAIFIYIPKVITLAQ